MHIDFLTALYHEQLQYYICMEEKQTQHIKAELTVRALDDLWGLWGGA